MGYNETVFDKKIWWESSIREAIKKVLEKKAAEDERFDRIPCSSIKFADYASNVKKATQLKAHKTGLWLKAYIF